MPMPRHFLFLLLLSALPAMAALEYGSSVDNTRWGVSGSVFACRFEQEIPDYGTAVFYHEAGEDVVFRLETLRNLMDYSQAQVSILPPPWQPANKTENLGTSPILKQSPNLSLDTKRTNQFLHALLEGKWPAISHKTYYDKDRFVQIHLSATAFTDHYRDYIDCVKQLLPMNFGQVARSKVLFGVGEEAIDKKDMELLDRIIFYIKHDPRVFAVYLDGHSDNQGRRYDNRQTSKARVEDVERYFVKQGIDPEMITTRFHGDRYPVATNKTPAGRAANRRVTIRIEQRQDMPIPDDLLFKPKNRGVTTAEAD
ncbi:flagellar protein MotY [Thalassolituus sp. LLYu03]|uniref:flagellar protein MotY n=1 Tax=Thalassolituus sp. LLYu03 TaxID=3421656 RepID=UPI003D29551E